MPCAPPLNRSCALYGRFGSRCSLSFDVEERRDERHLKFDLLATQRGGAGQGRDLVEGARELSNRFEQRGGLQRPLSGSAPKARGLFDQPGFGPVTREYLRSVLSNVREVPFESFRDASVQRTSRFAQKGAVGRILNQRVLKEITRMRRYTLREQYPGCE